MKQIRFLSVRSVRPSILVLLALAIVASLLFFHMRTLLPGLSQAEIMSRTDSSSIHHILKNPSNAPYKLLVYGFIRLHHQGILVLRGVAAMYGLLTLYMFFYILRRWQSGRIALLATILFATSSWFLHTTRTGTPDVLQFGLIIMVAAGLWLRSTPRRTLALYACVVAVAVSLYVPGFIWFAVAGILWRRKAISNELHHVSWVRRLLGILFFVILLAPLTYAVLKTPSLILNIAGLPAKLPTLKSLATNFINIPLFLFLRGQSLSPTTWLGRLPILDVFDITMFALGVYAFARHWRLDRAGLLLGIMLIGILLISSGGAVTITILIPFIYLIIAGGLTYMMHEWFSVFPRNPVARTVGISLMFLAIVASSGYQLDRYFVAWPLAPATKAAFTHQT